MDSENYREIPAQFRQFDKDGHDSDLFNIVAFFTYFDHNWESSGTNFRSRHLTIKETKGRKWRPPFGEAPENRTVTYAGRWWK